MYTHPRQGIALQELTDDELDALLAQIATERESRWKLRRRPRLVEDLRQSLDTKGGEASP
jgi:hypothetical protein